MTICTNCYNDIDPIYMACPECAYPVQDEHNSEQEHYYPTEIRACQHAGCTKQEAAQAYARPDSDEWDWYCEEHAQEAGYCLGCHTFCAGIESYDFSSMPGYCAGCVEEIKSEYDDELDYNDYDDEYDYEEDYY